MKTFRMDHLFSKNTTTVFDESSIPTWLTHKEYRWFLDKHVLTLSVGESVDTDFQRITRET